MSEVTLISHTSVPLAQYHSALQPVHSAPYVTLSPGIPWVKDKGWLTFSNGWTLTSVGSSGDPSTGSASWTARSLSRSNKAYGGQLDAMFPYLTPATKYAIMLRVGSSPASLRKQPAFVIHLRSGVAPQGIIISEEGVTAGGVSIEAQPPGQVIFMVIDPGIDPGDTGLANLGIVSVGLSKWDFYSLTVWVSEENG